MSDTKMLQLLLDGQKNIKDKLVEIEKKVEGNTKRIDKVFYEVADLSDDAPTVEEFDELKAEFKVFKQKFAS